MQDVNQLAAAGRTIPAAEQLPEARPLGDDHQGLPPYLQTWPYVGQPPGPRIPSYLERYPYYPQPGAAPLPPPPLDPPIFLLQAAPTWQGGVLPDGVWQRVPIGLAGQVLTVQADGSVAWGAGTAGTFVTPSGDTTGVTDTANIQAAIDANWQAGPGRGITQLSTGVFYITQLIVRDGMMLWGSGAGSIFTDSITGKNIGTVLRAKLGSTQHMIIGDTTVNTVSTPQIAYLTLDGNNGSNLAAPQQTPNAFDGIHFDQTVSTIKRFSIHHVTIQNVPNDGIWLSGGSFGSSFVGPAVSIILPYNNGISCLSSDVHFDFVVVDGAGADCFHITATQSTWTNCKSNGAGQLNGAGNGWSLQGSSAIVAGCSAENDRGTASPFTATLASPAVFTLTDGTAAYPLNTQVFLTGASLPAPFVAGTGYFVIGPSGSTFKLAATANGTPINSTTTGSGTVQPGAAASANSVYITGSRNMVFITASAASNALLYLDGATNNDVYIVGNNQTNHTQPLNVYQINQATTLKNRVQIKGNPTTIGGYGLLTGGGTEAGNDLLCENERQSAAQSIPFAASITPNPFNGGTHLIGTITGNTTINLPAFGHVGSQMTFVWTQDGTGGHTVSFAAGYILTTTPGTAAGSTNALTFTFNGSNWVETAHAP